MDSKILPFLQKIYFPASIFLGKQSFMFLKAIQHERKLIIIPKSLKDDNKELLISLFGDEFECFFQDREPQIEDFNKLKEHCQKNNYDYLIAVGGGSVIDSVKMVKKELNIKMVAFPTAVGSGAEVSQYVLLIDNGVKKVFSSPEFLPEIIILNTSFLNSLTKEQIIFQSIDALSHGLESLASKASNHFSDILALDSIEIIYKNLNKLNEKGNKEEILEELQIASILSGLAQSSAATGLCHALAHYFGVKNNISHSKAVAVFLTDVLDLNSKHTDKYRKIGRLKSLSSDNFVENLQELFSKLEIKLEKINVLSEDIIKAAEEIKKDICSLTNPYSPSLEEIIEIIKKHQ